MYADGCMKNDPKPAPTTTAAYTPPSPIPDKLPVYTPPPPPKALPYYTTREGGTYYYVAAVSKDDRDKGIVTGDVVAFKYYGKTQAGEHILRRVYDNGTESDIASYCKNPCTLIRDSDGLRRAYNGDSIIGAAFRDAFKGFLKVSTPTKPIGKLRPYAEPAQVVEPQVFEPATDSQETTENPTGDEKSFD